MSDLGNEGITQKLDRLRLMASGDSTWDLSDYDLAALRYVLTLLAERDAALESLKARAELADLIIKAWMELQYTEASDVRKLKLKIATIKYFGGGFVEIGGAYDALSGPREGEQGCPKKF